MADAASRRPSRRPRSMTLLADLGRRDDCTGAEQNYTRTDTVVDGKIVAADISLDS